MMLQTKGLGRKSIPKRNDRDTACSTGKISAGKKKKESIRKGRKPTVNSKIMVGERLYQRLSNDLTLIQMGKKSSNLYR